MTAIFVLLDSLLGFYALLLIISVVMSWLTTFGIINTYQPFVRSVLNFLHAVTEPALRPIRRFLPDMGGIDISPIILWFLIYALRVLLKADIAPLFGVNVY
ncbi:YggT family protein [Kordiimonas sp.]|uniref:YggT family protein n=1 Tax=Kordiimonas sp. TaxID=1970157 RepID=UPI003A949E51